MGNEASINFAVYFFALNSSFLTQLLKVHHFWLHNKYIVNFEHILYDSLLNNYPKRAAFFLSNEINFVRIISFDYVINN